MGIKDLYKILKEFAPNSYTTIPMEKARGYKAAVDVSIFLHKNIKSVGVDHWLDPFVSQFCKFKKFGIHMVAIFDGPNVPPEKKLEQERRRTIGENTVNKIQMTEEIVEELNRLIGVQDPLTDVLKEKIQICVGKKINSLDLRDMKETVETLQRWNERWKMSISRVAPDVAGKAREILRLMGIPSFVADGEAETLCAYMAVKGMVDVVITEDTDVIPYGTPIMLSKFNMKEETFCYVSFSDILRELEYTHEELRDLCILLSCDYNSRCKGYAPGVKKAKKSTCIGYKKAKLIIDKYRRIEHASGIIDDVTPLRYRRCRELFTIPEVMTPLNGSESCVQKIHLPLTRPVDWEGVKKFKEMNKMNIPLSFIQKSCEGTEIKVIE